MLPALPHRVADWVGGLALRERLVPVAEDLWVLPGVPPYAVNVLLVGDVVCDSGWPGRAGAIARVLEGRPLRAHLVSHAHQDHAGSSRALVRRLGLPVWAPAGDARDLEAGRMTTSGLLGDRVVRPLAGYPGVPVDRELHEGDVVAAGFEVLDAPGHSPGHVALWRAADRTLLAFDTCAGHLLAGLPALREPPPFFSVDPARNRASLRRLAALEPRVVCFGHGPPLRDGSRFVRWVAGLPAT